MLVDWKNDQNYSSEKKNIYIYAFYTSIEGLVPLAYQRVDSVACLKISSMLKLVKNDISNAWAEAPRTAAITRSAT